MLSHGSQVPDTPLLLSGQYSVSARQFSGHKLIIVFPDTDNPAVWSPLLDQLSAFADDLAASDTWVLMVLGRTAASPRFAAAALARPIKIVVDAGGAVRSAFGVCPEYGDGAIYLVDRAGRIAGHWGPTVNLQQLILALAQAQSQR